MKFFTTHRNNKGFTLLEILVVISIIGILIALGASAYSVAQRKSRDARRQGDLKQVQNAFEQYYANTGSYGTCAQMASAGFPSGQLPQDPKPGSSYSIGCNTVTQRYCACATLEGGGGNTSVNTGGTGTCTFNTGGTLQFYCFSNLQ